jgi:parallel beta-helix repeat protein
MSKDLPNADRGPTVIRFILTVQLLLIVILVISLMAQAEYNGTTRQPINIEGDVEMDTYFAGQEGDGLSSDTAYVLEGLEIAQGEEGYCLKVSSTTRHLIIKDCLFTATQGSIQDWGIHLDSAENIRIFNCEFERTGNGIGVIDSKAIVVESSSINQMAATGIFVKGTDEIWIMESRVNNCLTGILVDQSDGAFIRLVEVKANGMGILSKGTRSLYIEDCEVTSNNDVGVSIENCQTFHIRRNVVRWNPIGGIQVSGSWIGRVELNEVSGNYRGMIFSVSNQTHVEGNNVTRNDVLGIRLSTCSDFLLIDNTIRSNWNIGLNLVNSNGNTVRENTIYSHERGIVISGSRDNEIVENRILGNWVYGIEGDVDDNTVRDNEMRANGWLRGLFYLIIGLIVLGVAAGTYFWVKRRRLAKEEKDKVVIKLRFPTGVKALWPMSKTMWDEDFFKAQLATAGPQREDILRRYQQNIAAAKQMQYMAVGTMAVMLGFMAALPLVGVMNMATTEITSDNINDVLFASSMGIAVYYLMSFMILLVFGLLFTSQLMKGDIFKLLSTLPIDDKGARRIVAYLLFRMYGPPLVVVLLAFPVGGFLITWSLTFLVTALLMNGLYLIFVTYVLVLISDATSRRIFSANASKGATAMRFIIMAGYLMAIMFMFITLDFLTSYISGLFDEARAEGGSGEGINAFMSLLPFPFSGAYLISTTMVPGGYMSTTVIATTVSGLAIMGGLVFRMRRRVNYILARVARGVEHAGGGPGQVTTIDQVTIRTKRPRPAFMRNGLLVTSRDQGAIMYIIMPLFFPIIFIAPGADRADAGIYDAVLPFLFYMGIMSFLVNMALSSSDAAVGGLLGSLPFRVLDHYRAKWMTIVMIMVIPIAIITLVMVGISNDPGKMVALMVTLVPLVMVMASVYLMTFSLAFGNVNGKHTFFMAKIRMKLAKYVGIIVLQYALVIIELIVFYGLTESGVITFWAGIVGLWAVNITLLILLEGAARRLFG